MSDLLLARLQTLIDDGLSLAQIEAFMHVTRPPDARVGSVEHDAYQTTITGPAPSSHSPARTLNDDAPHSPILELDRYEDLGRIGTGGMGEVRLVRDRHLGRTLALKVVHRLALQRPSLLTRFREEARATAQLEHPGIIPIHDMGTLTDGRPWFTMKLVSGETFGHVIEAVHSASDDLWRETPTGWSLRRLIEVLRQVCEAVGYAHSRGVVHRDLKPDNIMVGAHGEVLVLDWGLAKVLGQPKRTTAHDEPPPVLTMRSQDSSAHTQVGQIAGTPAYMPLEQATGQVHDIDARSDVYALGAMLYTVLAGRPPYSGADAREVLTKVRNGPPEPLQGPTDDGTLLDAQSAQPDARTGRTLPRALVAACERAMARVQTARFASASELAHELQAWLDGSKRREDARAVVASAQALMPRAVALRAQAAVLQAEANALLEDIEEWRPEQDKAPGWAKEDEAELLLAQADLLELEEESLLRGSLAHAPDLPEAHATLAKRYRTKHEQAEALGRSAAGDELMLRRHLAHLAQAHPDRPAHEAYLEGSGALTLVTDPPGAEVLLHRYALQNRRLVATPVCRLGHTPLHAVPLPMGRYLCVLRQPGRADVRYPVWIRRGEHWKGIPPNGNDPHPIPLPHADELGPDDCYVPAGWAWLGGGPVGQRSFDRQRTWVGGQVFQRYPVTNRRYIEFLDALMNADRQQEALQYVPRERSGTDQKPGEMVYGLSQGRFYLRPDTDGDMWEADAPVAQVSWLAASAFARWEAARTGLAWRLPSEVAWEKAARGVDGRLYPWGDRLDPSWACMRRSHRARMVPATIDRFPVDQSVYGVRGLAGNMQDWCVDAFDPKGTVPVDWHAEPQSVRPTDPTVVRSCRGGGWFNTRAFVQLTHRYSGPATICRPNLSFRLVRSFP